jgi:class 3 adenylate cyclase
VATFDGPARAIRCAQALVGGGRRAGLHTGECVLGHGRVEGPAVDVAAAIAAAAQPGEVLTSSTVRDLVAGSGLDFAERGSVHAAAGGETREWPLHTAKGV